MDDRTEHLIREDAEVEHTFLTPLRWLMQFSKVTLVILACLMIFGGNASLWMVGCGSMGIHDRRDRAVEFLEHVGDRDSRVADFSIMLSQRGEPVTKADAEFYRHDLHLGPKPDYEGLPQYVPASGVSAIPDDSSDYHHPEAALSFCSAHASDQEPGMALEGWFDRSRSVFGRKASRMYEAYVTGAVAMTALRVTLTEMKLGRNPLNDLSAEPGQPNSLCHVDPFDVTQIPEAEYARWVKVSRSIDLTEAPYIMMRMVQTGWEVPSHPEDSGNAINESTHQGWIISGMCVRSECFIEEGVMEQYNRAKREDLDLGEKVLQDDRNFYVTPYADLFSTTPPLSDHQVHAVDALNRLATDDFWIAEAHRNGIYDEATIRTMATRTRELITKMVAPHQVPKMDEGGNAINFIGEEE